ncbi:hypothetical protein [Phenylobacterium sp. J367]|uniref:hypothetical protein n=1 Tax=Phenylobacterium sp. J367 TaxID=2898435 RepID=UPI002150B06B|nr:hypothetical protein [Phenylobacterium sp. J367]MCR5876987.1 hypothetical protein [Phenylobacterium sp. J367]MCR5881185.1 hypothetical protein [Phenylobacterium sp. J367]
MDNALPAVARLLQRRYLDARRAYVADPANGLRPWPKRPTKRKPIPGLYEAPQEVEG